MRKIRLAISWDRDARGSAGRTDSPRTLPDTYSPWRNSTDVSINKDIRFGGARRASLRLEIINLFDNPWYAAMQSVASGNANFGKVTSQGNYSRTMQMTGRFSF